MDNKQFEQSLASKLAEARIARGISQAKLQSDIGINIGRIESGAYSIELKTYLRICTYLKVDCCEILNKILTRKYSDATSG